MPTYTISTEADVSLVAATAKTILAAIAAATRRLRLVEFGVSFAEEDTTKGPALVEIMRFASNGTGTALSEILHDPGESAALFAGQYNYSAEPGTPTLIKSARVSVLGGLWVHQYLPGREPVIAVSTLAGIRITAPDAATGVRAWMTFEE